MMEAGQTMSGADRSPSRGLQRLFFQAPAWIYWGPFARLLAWRCILRLTTVGRRTGRPRHVTISFLPLEQRLAVLSAWGGKSDWLRNVQANPRVTVRVGRDEFAATARLVVDRAERAELVRQMAARSQRCGPPKPIRPLVNMIFNYEADVARAVALDGNLPVLELVRQ
jgi:deazaflavin-dependent oxidoreductase (nitroreductase family)